MEELFEIKVGTLYLKGVVFTEEGLSSAYLVERQYCNLFSKDKAEFYAKMLGGEIILYSQK